MSSSNPTCPRALAPRFLLAPLCFALALLGARLAAQPAATRTFDVPAQSAETALKIFSDQSGQGLIMNANTVRGITTHSVRGEFTPADALSQMLAGTGLVATQDAKSGSFAVHLEDPLPNDRRAAPTSARPARQMEPEPAKTGTPEEVVNLTPFIVSGEGDRGYNAVNTIGASRVNTAIKNTPMSVVVINNQFIQDIGAIDAYDAARYTSGVSGAGAPRSGQMTLRGQNIAGGNYHDGILDNTAIGGANMITLAVADRMEIVKGPAGTLYGSHNSGGIVNVISKKPQPKAATSVKVVAGTSVESYGFELDTTGPVNDRFSYRLILAAEDGKYFRGDYDQEQTLGLMGQYRTPTGGTVLLQYYFMNPVRSTNAQAWITDKDGKISYFLPRDQPISEKDTRRDHTINRVDLTITQPFKTGAVDWTGRLALRYASSESYALYYTTDNASHEFFDASGTLIGNMNTVSFSDPRFASIRLKTRTRAFEQYQNEGVLANLDFVGDFTTGAVKHRLLTYGTFETRISDYQYYTQPYPGIDLSHRVYYSDTASHVTGPTQQASNDTMYADLWAAGAQLNSSILEEKVILVAGLREDYTVRTNILRIANSRTYNDVRKGTSRKLGLVVRPLEPLALYYNYSETFLPQGFTPEGAKYPNLIPINNEVGAKLNLFKDTIVINAAYFNTVTENALISVETGMVDQFGRLINVTRPAGQLKVRGWESDFTVAVNDNLAVIGGIGSLTSRNALGIRSRAVPEGVNYKAFVKYTFTSTFLQGAFIGYGYEKNSDRAGEAGDGFNMPGYTTSDLVVGYKHGHWAFQANVANVWDQNYPYIAVARTLIYPGDPRTVRLTTRYTW